MAVVEIKRCPLVKVRLTNIFNYEPILGAANIGLALFFSITSLKK